MAPPAPPTTSDFHHGNDYHDLSGSDRAGIMWEWLRRDLAYQDWYAGMREAEIIATKGVAIIHQPVADMCDKWGLLFRRRPAH
jgi:hypothetical protein